MSADAPLLLAAFERAGELVVGVLAIAGGFLVGSWLTYAAIKLLGKFVFKKKLEGTPTRLARFLGGMVVAIIVFYFVFGKGGFGWGTGGGTADTQGKGEQKAPDVSEKKDVKEPVKKDEKAPPTEGQLPEEHVRITVLGGADVKEGKFYLVDDDPHPRTLEEVRALVKGRAGKGPKALRGLWIYIYSNSADRGTLVVSDLERLARELGLSVTFPPVENQKRPGT